VRAGTGGRGIVSEVAAPLPHGLTPRELDVLRLVAAGLSNRAISERLVVTARTVGTHVEHLLAKLEADGRAALAARAVREGLLELPGPQDLSSSRCAPDVADLPSAHC